MAKLYNLARVATSTTGTGTTIALGAAIPGYLTFAAAGTQNGDVIDVAFKDGNNSQVGTATFDSSGPSLTNLSITKSTNSDTPLSLSGTAEVFISPRAETMITRDMFIGAVGYFAFQTPPAGWLERNGSAILIAAYPALAAAIYCGDANNATAPWGYKATTNVSPSTNRSTSGTYLVLMDDRGIFDRGWDHSAGVDSGRAFGTYQADDNKAHAHTVTDAYTPTTYALYLGNADYGYRPDAMTSTTRTTSTSGGTEARPKNRAYLACIYAGV